jgi:hypothetical protein
MFIVVDICHSNICIPPSLFKGWKAVHHVYFVFNNATCIAISREHQTFIQHAKKQKQKQKQEKNIIS